MFPVIPTPTELIVSPQSGGLVTKKLILRNNLPQDVLLKLVHGSDAIRLDADRLRIAARTVVELALDIEMDKVARRSIQLVGYIRVMSQNKLPQLGGWMTTAGAETKRQKAFSLQLRVTADKFSAQNTVVDLPGQALMVSTPAGIVGVDDVETPEQFGPQADVFTAKDCESIAEYVAEMRAIKTAEEAKLAGWGYGAQKAEMKVTPCGGN